MSSFQTIIICFFGVVVLDVIILWVFHKTTVYFKKLDEAVGNTEINQMTGKNDSLNVTITYQDTSDSPDEDSKYLTEYENSARQTELRQ